MNARTSHLIPALAAVATAAILSTGCLRHGYGSGEGVNYVRPDVATLTDLTRTTRKMVGELCTSQAFRAKYDEVKNRVGGSLPVIQIGNFDNDVVQLRPGENVRQYTTKLDICRAKAREQLQDCGLFRLVDDTNSFGSDTDKLNTGVISDIDIGMVDPKNVHHAGSFTAADFCLLGSLRRQEDGDRFYYIFEVRLYDLATRDMWTKTEIFEKF